MALKNVSFAIPFFDEISKYPVKFAVPVFFGDSPNSSYAASLRNGSATLLRLGDRFLGVTCHHVLEGFRQSRETQRGIFQLGPIRMDPEQHLISEDHERDIAVIDLTGFVDTVPELSVAKFVQPTTWPPGDVSTDDVICLAGFPGIWRDQMDLGYLRFYSYSSGAAEVVSVRDEIIVTTVQITDCVIQINHGKVWGSLGGLSGGPVFVWRKTPILVAELVGFIFEYQESLDLMFVRSATVIRDDGRIVAKLLGS